MRQPSSMLVCVAALTVASVAIPRAVQSDLDTLMASVLATRDENWKKLRQ